jgi:hypothetical protein
MKTVWIYTDTGKQVGDPHHLHVFASREAADRWLNEFDPEGVAFEYPVFGREAAD